MYRNYKQTQEGYEESKKSNARINAMTFEQYCKAARQTQDYNEAVKSIAKILSEKEIDIDLLTILWEDVKATLSVKYYPNHEDIVGL